MKSSFTVLIGLLWAGPATILASENSHWPLRNSNVTSADKIQSSSNDLDLQSIVMTLLDRVQSLETALKAQQEIIQDMETKLSRSEALHRFLQEKDSDCLPHFVDSKDGPYCQFDYWTLFQDHVTFDDDVTFNENVEFDLYADCMPVYDREFQTCVLKDNFTYLGDVEFYNYTAFLNDSQVFFEKEVQFYDDVYFEGHVKLEGDVTIANSHYDIDFKVDDKVRVNFSPDYAIRINKGTIFSKNVDIRKDLKVNGDVSVLGHTYLGATDIDGYLSVSDDCTVHGELHANHGISCKRGLKVKDGRLDVEKDGVRIFGHSTFKNDVTIEGDLTILGSKVYDQLTVSGLFTANGGAVINAAHNKDALQVNGKSVVHGNLDVSRRIIGGSLHLDGEGVAHEDNTLYVVGDGQFTGDLVAANLGTYPPDAEIDIDIDVFIENFKIKAKDSTFIFADVCIGDCDSDANKVTTLNRLGQYTAVEVKDLQVQKVEIAEQATVNGQTVLTTDDMEAASSGAASVESSTCLLDACSAEDIALKLQGQFLDVSSVTADRFRQAVVNSDGSTSLEDLALKKDIPSSSGVDGDDTCGCNVNDITALGFELEPRCDCPAPEVFCDCPVPDPVAASCECDVSAQVGDYLNGLDICRCSPEE